MCCDALWQKRKRREYSFYLDYFSKGTFMLRMNIHFASSSSGKSNRSSTRNRTETNTVDQANKMTLIYIVTYINLYYVIGCI